MQDGKQSLSDCGIHAKQLSDENITNDISLQEDCHGEYPGSGSESNKLLRRGLEDSDSRSDFDHSDAHSDRKASPVHDHRRGVKEAKLLNCSAVR